MSTGSNLIQIMTVDDHPLLRQGIAALLKTQSDMELVAEACDGEEAIALYRVPESLRWFADVLVRKSDGPEALLAAIEKAMNFKTAAKRSPIQVTAGTGRQPSADWQAT